MRIFRYTLALMLGKRPLRLIALVGSALLCAIALAAPATAAPPSNDDFADAFELSGFPITFTGTNVEATEEAGEWEGTGSESENAGHSIWFKWTAPSTETVKVDTCAGTADTLLAVFVGSTFPTRTLVADNDQHSGICSTTGDQSAVVFEAIEGQTYRIVVDTWHETLPLEDEILLSVASPVPANDSFATPEVLSPDPVSKGVFVEANNSFASKEAGEPNHGGDSGGASLWYLWEAPATGRTAVFVCDPDFAVGVYEGTEVSALTPVTDLPGVVEDCEGVYFQATDGDFYSIAVDGKFDGSEPAIGSFALYAVMPPANDLLENATEITGDSYENDLVTVGALTEELESTPGDFTFGSSVWFTWTAPKAGNVALATCGSTYDTLVGVYATTATAVGSVGEAIAFNDDSAGPKCATGPEVPEGPPLNRDSELSFHAEAGATYKISVTGYRDPGPLVLGEAGLLHFSLLRTDDPLIPIGPAPEQDRTPPDTKLGKMVVKAKKRKASFVFSSSEAGSTFICKLDKKVASSCRSPKAYKNLKPGKHVFTVTGTDAFGNTDPTPAVAKFKIAKAKKTKRR